MDCCLLFGTVSSNVQPLRHTCNKHTNLSDDKDNGLEPKNPDEHRIVNLNIRTPLPGNDVESNISINCSGCLAFRILLNQVRAAVPGAPAPDKTLRVQGQSQKQKMCCGRTSCTVLSATRPAPARPMWKALR